MNQGLYITAEQSHHSMCAEIAFYEVGRDGELLTAARPVTMEPVERGTVLPVMLTVAAWDKPHPFQRLMDDLWRIGLRPRDIGTAGHLAATQEHLGDMRAIVGNLLKVEFPGRDRK